ncbi:hypothetical protein AB0H83_22950 [Dactylosporangium sp. NPDC050688]|uniref:hypothetical protein n=1 Tax=Dactylosporangium sp. NPDC050688 TaxID=3157217 RepID=UPI0033E17771
MWFVVPYLLWHVAKAVFRLMPVLWRNRTSVILAALAVWLWHRQGWEVLALVAGVAGATVGVWWWRWRPWCERFVVLPALSWWQRLFVYQLHWREAMTVCRLAERFDGKLNVPRLLRVRCTYVTDEVVLRMPRGQNPRRLPRGGGEPGVLVQRPHLPRLLRPPRQPTDPARQMGLAAAVGRPGPLPGPPAPGLARVRPPRPVAPHRARVRRPGDHRLGGAAARPA